MYDDFEFAFHNTYISFHFFLSKTLLNHWYGTKLRQKRRSKGYFFYIKIPMYISSFQISFLLASLKHYQIILVNPCLRSRGTIWYSQSEWLFLLKFLWTKIVIQFVFLVKSIVFIHMFLNLWNNNAFISF